MFAQGMFRVDPNATPEQVKRKREMIAAIMPRFGSAKYVGEGLGQLATGFAIGRQNKGLDAAEATGRKSAADAMAGIYANGGTAQPNDFTVSGPGYTPPPAKPAGPEYPLGVEGGLPQNPQSAGYDMGKVVKPQSFMPEDVKNGIFAGESGGDYNALFGFANRPGGKFENVRLTEMTVDQALDFANPSGQYGQTVKGQVGRVATPMGAYQVVGTTLRAAKEGLGLTGTEVMTPELQDQIGGWILNAQGTGAWEGYRGPQDSFTPQGGDAVTMSAQNAPQGYGIDTNAIFQALQNPWLSQDERATLTGMLDQDRQANDPMRLMDLEMKKLELDKMRNPGTDPMDAIALEQAQLDLDQDRAGPVPDPGYAMVTPDEVASLGLPPGAYQRGADGKISEIGGGGQTINVGGNNDIGTIPPGMKVDRDAAGNVIGMSPIPGGPAEAESADSAAAAGVKAGIADTTADVVISAASAAREADGERVLGGMFGGLAAANPSTPNAEVYRQVATLKSNGTFAGLAAMRASSPTGAAIGSASDRDLQLLADKAGALDPASPNFASDLDDYERTLLRTIYGPQEGDARFESSRPNDTSPAAGADTATISSDAEYDALPSGTTFVGPDGKTRRKP